MLGPLPMIEAYGRTDVGRRRKINEDSFLVSPETSLYAVCDGMGGHNAGEVASKMAIETISAFVERSAVEKEITWPWGLDANVSFEANRLKTAIRLANARVYQAADRDGCPAGRPCRPRRPGLPESGRRSSTLRWASRSTRST